MNNYNCEIVADSLNILDNRITTFKLTYPRIVHSELMTHRMFSRNAASSRAVPVRKMIESVKKNMFTPLAIQKSHKGMQGSDYFKEEELEQANQLWIESAELALQQAEKMEKFGVTKQLINRMLEPYQYYQVLVTATEWENFFELRCPQYLYDYEDEPIYFKSKKDWVNYYNDSQGYKEENKEFTKVENLTYFEWLSINKSQADIHIQAIAEMMWDAYNESTPKQLKAGEWHIPYGDNIDLSNFNFGVEAQSIQNQLYRGIMTKVKIATARCARISYQTLGDNPKIDYKADIRLHDMLAESGHWSPFEHCAKAMSDEKYYKFQSGELYPIDTLSKESDETTLLTSNNTEGWCKNFRGFIQYRHLIENT